jgi:hypothetical protein
LRHVRRFNGGMPNLTRRRSDDRPDGLHIGNVQAGTIAKRVGNPYDTDLWEWSCGRLSGHPREIGPAPPPALLHGHLPKRARNMKNGDLG